MSSHYSANQYDRAFSPQRLQNYQIPAYHKEHPSLRKGNTTIISNERGHLVSPGHRSNTSPWGTFVGTWQMERKPIELKTKTKLLTYVAQTGMSVPGSRQSSRASSARPATGEHCTNGNAINSDLNEENSRPPSQRNISSPTGSEANSRPATVSSIRSSVQGSRVESPLGSVRSPTPIQSTRAVSTSTRSVSIVSNRSPSNDLHTTPPQSVESSRPQSPQESRVDSRLQASGRCSQTQTPNQNPV